MNKFFKAVITVQLILITIISCTLQGFCAENNNYSYLLSCGYPEEFLDNLTETTINEIVKLHGDNTVVDVICETEYWPDNTKENAKVIIKSVVAVMQNADGDRIAGESICVYWEWVENKPLIKGEDMVSVYWSDESLVLEGDSFYAEDYYKNNADDEWVVSDSHKRLARCSLDSLGHYADFREFENYVGGSMSFNLAANSPISTETDFNKFFLAEYEHHISIWVILLPLIIITVIILTVRKVIISRKSS